jgi:hypothetical protein
MDVKVQSTGIFVDDMSMKQIVKVYRTGIFVENMGT